MVIADPVQVFLRRAALLPVRVLLCLPVMLANGGLSYDYCCGGRRLGEESLCTTIVIRRSGARMGTRSARIRCWWGGTTFTGRRVAPGRAARAGRSFTRPLRNIRRPFIPVACDQCAGAPWSTRGLFTMAATLNAFGGEYV